MKKATAAKSQSHTNGIRIFLVARDPTNQSANQLVLRDEQRRSRYPQESVRLHSRAHGLQRSRSYYCSTLLFFQLGYSIMVVEAVRFTKWYQSFDGTHDRTASKDLRQQKQCEFGPGYRHINERQKPPGKVFQAANAHKRCVHQADDVTNANRSPRAKKECRHPVR